MEKLKVDQIKSVMNCNYFYRDPVWLPCYETICLEDLDKLRNANGEIQCTFCGQLHNEPIEGFPTDKKTSKLLELQINKIDFGAAFNRGKNLLNILNEELTRLENLKQNPNQFIETHFSELKDQISNRKKEIDIIIQECADKLLDEMRKYQEECKALAINIKPNLTESDTDADTIKEDSLQTDLNELRVKLNDWFKDFDQVELDEAKRDKILNELEAIIPIVMKKSVAYQQKLLQNNLVKLEFDSDSKEKIQSGFGRLKFDEITPKKSPHKRKHDIESTKIPQKKLKVTTVPKKARKPSPQPSPKATRQRKSLSRPSKGMPESNAHLQQLTEDELRRAINDIIEKDKILDKNKSFNKQVYKAISEQLEARYREFHFNRNKLNLVEKLIKEVELSRKRSDVSTRRTKREDVLSEIKTDTPETPETPEQIYETIDSQTDEDERLVNS